MSEPTDDDVAPGHANVRITVERKGVSGWMLRRISPGGRSGSTGERRGRTA